MESKQMYIADINAVFGKTEEPLIRYMDEIVVPALTMDIEAESSEKTKYFFEDVAIKEIKGDYVLSGLLIKDTILEVKSEYTQEDGLVKMNKRFKSSPYSLFLIYLKNHRMMLVKNQSGSPDTRAFAYAFRTIIDKYTKNYNDRVRQNSELVEKNYLPSIRVKVAGIKTSASVKEALVDVEKIKELTIKFYPLNSEWDYGNVYGDIDSKIRKVIGSSKGKMTFPSPKNFDGVAAVIEATEGMAQTEMKVRYKKGTHGNKQDGKIKDNEISDVANVEISGDLDSAYEEIAGLKQEIFAMNVESQNNLIEYEEYIRKKNKGRS